MEKKKSEIQEKKPRYNETQIITKYLKSKNGIPFLFESLQKTRSFNSQSTTGQGLEMDQKIDELIDFYTCWTRNFPVRKNLKMSKYEFLKTVEDFCAKNEVAFDMQSLFEN